MASKAPSRRGESRRRPDKSATGGAASNGLGAAHDGAAPRFDREAVLPISIDWYWELDAEFRFVHVAGTVASMPGSPLGESCLGRTPCDVGLVVRGDDWSTLLDKLTSGEVLRRTLAAFVLTDGARRYMELSAAAVLDAQGKVTGYQGTGYDVTEREEHENESRQFRAAVDASLDRVYLIDYDTTRFLYANQTACDDAGLTLHQHRKVKPHIILSTTEDKVRQMYDAVVEAGETGLTSELAVRDRHGNPKVVALHRRAVRVNDSWLIISMTHDITQRKQTERANERLRRMFAALSTTNEAILRARTIDDLYQRVCDAAVEGGKLAITGVLMPDPRTGDVSVVASAGATEEQRRTARVSIDPTREEGQGLVGRAFRNCESWVSNDLRSDQHSGWWRSGNTSSPLASAAAIPLVRDRKAIGVLLFFSHDVDAFDSEIVKLLERMAENVSFALENFDHEIERKRSEERVQYLATHDGLTGLPNRVMFNQLLQMSIETARRYERQFALMFIDLDRFKIVNDTLGHEAGDTLLKEMSARLRGCLRASDVVARLGGDEFVILLQEVQERQQVEAVARKIISATLKPITIMNQECRVTASIGITFCPIDGDDPQVLMKNADMAMYLAKEQGKNNFQFFSKDIKSRAVERLMLETHLRRALERGDELSLHYQAKLDLTTGAVSGAEALLRWDSPTLGSVSPAQLIPVAEETGLIVPIGRWVLRTACEQNMKWQRQGLPALPMAINLSPRQFADPHLLTDISDVLEETGMPASLLEVEITETMVMHDVDGAVRILNAVKALGVRVAIDDFGTGYSSLAQLKRFPIDTLKVDRSFIRDLPMDAEDRSITEAIIAMGKNLSLTIIAEGVETLEQQTFLRSHACDEMQGYYFARPVAAEEFTAFITEHLRKQQSW